MIANRKGGVCSGSWCGGTGLRSWTMIKTTLSEWIILLNYKFFNFFVKIIKYTNNFII
jgi:hypothetical protein